MNSKTVQKYMEFIPEALDISSWNSKKAFIKTHKWELQKKYFDKYPDKRTKKKK